MLLLELFETGEESRPLAAGDRDLGRLQEPAQLGSRRVDDQGGQYPSGDGGQDVVLDEIGRAASGAAAKGGAAVVTPFGASLEVRLPAHPGPALAVEQAAQDVVTERSRLVADPGSGGDCCGGPAVLRLGQDRVVASGTFVATTFLDREPQVEATSPPDVLDRVAGPHAAVRDTLAVHELGDLDERSLGELVSHVADDGGLLGHDLQLAGMDEAARGVAQAAVSERVVAAVPTVLE
jgi:hypothetical protein